MIPLMAKVPALAGIFFYSLSHLIIFYGFLVLPIVRKVAAKKVQERAR
jgi:hypothetical protein